MFADYHIHTNFSDDSEVAMEEVILQAIDLGMEEICFTDHVDYFETCPSHVINYEDYFKEYQQLKIKYKDKIILKAGIEFGVQKHTIPSFDRDFAQYDFDFIILSNHQIDDKEFWTGDYQQNKTREEYNRQYYLAIKDVVENYHNYSVLGHLDMIKRYDQQGSMDDSHNEEIIKAILKTVIDMGKGIEVNTSSFRYQLPDTTPSRKILNWYYELGGRILTIGSDSHCIDHLGNHFTYIKEELRKIGFKEHCTYHQMKPLFHKL